MMQLVMILAIILPAIIVLWLGNFTLSTLIYGHGLSPVRLTFATLLPLYIACSAYKNRSLDFSGAVSAWFVGFFLTLASSAFFTALLAFFIVSSKATTFRQDRKKKIEANFKSGGQRNWKQVLCNGGFATELAILYLLEVGCGERPLDFTHDYRASVIGVALLGAVSCCAGDTLSSELGIGLTTAKPRLITTLRTVPQGTNGGVTVVGIACSAIGGFVVGLTYYVFLVLFLSKEALEHAPQQYPVIYLGVVGGLVGSIVDSILGALFQFSGQCAETGVIVEQKGPNIIPISGLPILDNHSINLISSVITAYIISIYAPYGICY